MVSVGSKIDANEERVGKRTGWEVCISDGNGNLIEDGTYRYEWDAMGRLRRVRRASDGVVVGEYVYDHLNRRLLRRADVDGDGAWDEEVRYVYAGWRVVEERDAATGRLLRDYVYGNYIDEVVQGRYDKNNDGDMEDVGEVFYYVHNAQYSISALADAAGDVVEHYRYLPYGEVRVYTGKGADGEWFTEDDEEGSFSRSMYAFTGRRYDPESGLYYFRNRYYSAGLGRFITRDPAGYVDGLNMYRGYFVPNGVDGKGLGIWSWIWDWITGRKKEGEKVDAVDVVQGIKDLKDEEQTVKDVVEGLKEALKENKVREMNRRLKMLEWLWKYRDSRPIGKAWKMGQKDMEVILKVMKRSGEGARWLKKFVPFAAGLGEDVIMAMVKGMDAFAGSSDCRSFFMSAMRGDCDGMEGEKGDCVHDVATSVSMGWPLMGGAIYQTLDSALDRLVGLCREKEECEQQRVEGGWN